MLPVKTPVAVLLFLLCFTSAGTAGAQIEKTIDSLKAVEQQCLDKGIRMQDCSYRFMVQMDSLLNIEYQSVYARLEPEQQKALKKEELLWLKKRDAFYKKEQYKIDHGDKWAGLQGADLDMTVYDEKAEFIRKRIVEIEDKYNKK